MRCIPSLAAATLCLAPALAPALEIRAPDPAFIVTVPGLPEIPLQWRAVPLGGPAAVEASGAGARYEAVVSVSTPKAHTSPRECAGAILRALIARPGMPAKDDIYRAPLDDRTFLVLYVLKAEGGRQLHAHLLSAVGGAQCVEVHVSRSARDGEDDDEWRRSFAGARIEDADK